MPQICRNASSAPRPARRSAPSSSASFTARSRPMIARRGLERDARGRPLQRQHVRRPHPVADRHATLAREHRGDQLVGVVAVAPADHLLGLQRLSGDRVEGELPLELRHDQDGVAVRPDHQHRQPFERHRPVAGQVHEVGRRRHHDGLQPILRRLRGQPLPPGQVIGRHSFSRIDRGTIWNVAGVVPRSSPSATIGSGRSASIDTRISGAHLADVRMRDVVAVPVHGRQQRVRVRSGTREHQHVGDAVARERARRQPHPTGGELRVADDHVEGRALVHAAIRLDPDVPQAGARRASTRTTRTTARARSARQLRAATAAPKPISARFTL